MIQKFKYKDMEIQVKTNMLKGNKCHFGQDILGELEKAYNDAIYKKSKESTTETYIIHVNKLLKSVNIKPYKITMGNLIYMGVKMTDIDKQTTLEE